jgi:hypothetical protein
MWVARIVTATHRNTVLNRAAWALKGRPDAAPVLLDAAIGAGLSEREARATINSGYGRVVL